MTVRDLASVFDRYLLAFICVVWLATTVWMAMVAGETLFSAWGTSLSTAGTLGLAAP